MKWYTCTPVAFGGGPDFFARDSGLLSRGFQAVGVESRAIMPGEPQPDDLAELIRTDYQNLESPSWWKDLELDGIVLYAWGSPRFRKVAQAIRQAGVRLVLNQDSSGLVSPYGGFGDWLEEQRIVSGFGRIPGGLWRLVRMVARGLSIGLVVTDPLRARHLSEGHWITAVCPVAAERYRRLCRRYRGESLADRVGFLPHPVDPRFTLGDGTKGDRVVSVGRWNDENQKRTTLLIETLTVLLNRDEQVSVDLVGEPGDVLNNWHRGLPPTFAKRVVLHGRVDSATLVPLTQAAAVSYCPSAFESFHIASAEALCCGATVVAGRAVSLASFEWFLSEDDGRRAEDDRPSTHAAAIHEALQAWRMGKHDAASISKRWSERVHAPKVAARVLEHFDQKDGRSL